MGRLIGEQQQPPHALLCAVLERVTLPCKPMHWTMPSSGVFIHTLLQTFQPCRALRLSCAKLGIAVGTKSAMSDGDTMTDGARSLGPCFGRS